MKFAIIAAAAILVSGGEIDAQKQPLVLQVRNLDGKLQWLSDFQGKVVLLNFWSTTCPPCRVETPWFVEFQKRWASRWTTT
jgi:cytochrome c biogenesis protein CcmG/thiol:disulfide interchange protein DsbE